MRILNFGSLNIDHVYKVDNFVRPGETISAKGYSIFCGGKGLNQSIAAAKAGAEVFHAGKVGRDGFKLIEKLKSFGVDISRVQIGDDPTGHAIIQVDSKGQNCIIIHGGSNRTIAECEMDQSLAGFGEGDVLLLQNEINGIPSIMRKAKDKGMWIAMNPAPMGREVHEYPMELVDIFIINEIEGAELSGRQNDTDIIDELSHRYPNSTILLTLGSRGAVCLSGGETFHQGVYDVNAVDTTAAGDTFSGYFLAALLEGREVGEAMKLAAKASAICVSRPGASDSIPFRDEVEKAHLELKK